MPFTILIPILDQILFFLQKNSSIFRNMPFFLNKKESAADLKLDVNGGPKCMSNT